MGFNNFRVNVLLRVALLAALCVATAWSWTITTWQVTPFVCGAMTLLATMELVRYVEKTSRELDTFLSFIAYHDFATPITLPQKGGVFDQLQRAYHVLSTEFRRLNRQKAANHQYLEAVVEHVGVALFCLDEQGNVTMMNEGSRRLFGVPFLNSLRSFARIDERLPALLEVMQNGDRRQLSVRRGDELLELVLYVTTFELLEQRYKLVSFQNIRNELDQQEIDSWQKLIRVLTHEIMNSVTPITSLSRLIRETMIDDRSTPPSFRSLTAQEQDDMLRSVTAIHARSTGLLDFVQAYRSFARLPAPAFADVEVRALLERVHTLLAQDVNAKQIELVVRCFESNMRIHADAHQIEQVLINLVRNALEALVETPAPRIELRAQRDDREKVLLQVIDNGPGIDPAHIDSIFVPFFTTKRSGTGVGLSISRQIVHANRGTISVRSAPGDGSIFTLRFN